MWISELAQLETVKRLQSLIADKFQLNLEFKSLISAEVLEGASGSLIKNGTLVIPFFYKSEYLLTVNVHKIDLLETNDQEALISMIKLVLEPVVIGWHLSHLDFKPESFVTQQLGAMKLKPLGLKRSDIFMLEGGRPNTLHKVAFELHDLKGHWSFLSWSQISSSLKSVQDIKELGEVTIFIEDFGVLSPSEIHLIEEFIQCELDESPMIIIGTLVPINNLISENRLSERFIAQTKEQLILVDSLPSKMSVLREVLEFFTVDEAL